MRNISFSATTAQVIQKTKTVTRRLGWKALKPGTQLQSVEKGMGLKKGEKVRRLGVILVVDVRREPLNAITSADCIREGFPALTPQEFVEMFCANYRCQPETQVTRIAFRYL